MEAPVVNVGIMTEKAVSFLFQGEYVHTETGLFLSGEQRALFMGGKIVFNGKFYQELFFEPAAPASAFELRAVTIGAISTGSGKKTSGSKARSILWRAKQASSSSTKSMSKVT